MKLPHHPPETSDLFAILEPGDVQEVLQLQPGPLVKDAYLHWDELRHRNPPEGLDHEKWWLGIKWARQALLKPLPLVDKGGRPFWFGSPEPVLIDMVQIDQYRTGSGKFERQTAFVQKRQFLH